MEREMSDNTKKYLWIAVAVSFFVLIVAGAAFLLFRPTPLSNRTPFEVDGTAEPKQTQTTDYSAQTSGTEAPAPSPDTGKSGDIYIVYGDKGQSTTTVVTTVPAPVQPKPTPTTINATPTTINVTPTTTVKMMTTKATTSQPATTKPTTTVAKPAVPAAPGTTSGQYWIQAGMFSLKDNANILKAAIEAKSIRADISVRDKGGKSFFVVKAGPYANKAEAGKHLAAVRLVKGAEQSWITQ